MHRAVPLTIALIASGIAGCAHTHSAAGSLAVATPSAHATGLYQTERTLWSDQLVWSRQYIAAAFAGGHSAHVARTQLQRSQEAIGESIAPYYGRTAGEGLTAMLKVQVGIDVELIRAVQAGDLERKEEVERRLHENSNAIARYLAGLNPYWSPTELEALLNRYGQLSAQDIVARKDGHVDADDEAPDGSREASQLADVIAEGIHWQFPHGPMYEPRNTH
jgi:hypothetical protein